MTRSPRVNTGTCFRSKATGDALFCMIEKGITRCYYNRVAWWMAVVGLWRVHVRLRGNSARPSPACASCSFFVLDFSALISIPEHSAKVSAWKIYRKLVYFRRACSTKRSAFRVFSSKSSHDGMIICYKQRGCEESPRAATKSFILGKLFSKVLKYING